MLQLSTCASCKGFLGIAVTACPHCGAALGRARQLVMGAAALAGGSAVSMTLMACYGPGCVDDACGDLNGYDYDGGRVAADARVSDDGSTDARLDAPSDSAADAADAGDASLDAGPSDAKLDALDAADASGG